MGWFAIFRLYGPLEEISRPFWKIPPARAAGG
jgi:hypothetical protein